MSRLARLEAARLLDWRFLLPESLAGSWALAGAVPPRLADAMAAHGCRVAGTDLPGALDGVAARDPDLRTLLALVTALRPGGAVYVEVSRGRSRPRTVRGWGAALERAEVEVLGLHWHAPGFDGRTRIVPLDGVAGVRDTLSRHEGLRLGRLQALGGRALLAVGLLDLVVPSASVVGRRR